MNFSNFLTFKRKHLLNLLLVLILIFVEVSLFRLLNNLTLDGHTNGVFFTAIAIVIGWIGIVLAYLVWAIYFYNINFGLTNEDWKKIRENVEKAKQRKSNGEAVSDAELAMPSESPYKAETFGLPPGTIRGIIAISMLIGGFSLIIVAIGGVDLKESEQKFVFEFLEFYKKAFLMMIAFYFGSQSLKYLSSDKFEPIKKDTDNKDIKVEPSNLKVSEVIVENPNVSGDMISESETVIGTSSTVIDVPVTSVAYIVNKSEDRTVINKKLVEANFESAAMKLGVEIAVIKAVTAVESAGSGFIADGRVKILFEGHIFWKYLIEFKEDPKKLQTGNEDIIYPRWDRTKYSKSSSGEYLRFDKALAIHRKAAIYSASYGLFQIMGFNFKAAGFDNEENFYEAMQVSEGNQLDSFVNYILHRKLNDELKEKRWADFAKAYNGPAYEKNAYHLKLERAYDKYDLVDNPLINVIISRQFNDNDKQTRGVLNVFNLNRNIFNCKTLELAENGFKPNIGHIPAGVYEATKINTVEYPNSIQLLNVPGHNGIYIKTGNYMEQIRSCILVGVDWIDINKDGYLDISSSRQTLNSLFKILPAKFKVTVLDQKVKIGITPTSI